MIIQKIIKQFFKSVNNEQGLVGVLMVMTVSFAIFTVLSTAHIYTLKHGKYQRQIREASIMQIESENFAMMVRSAYENGKISTPCSGTCGTAGCCLDGVCFEDLFSGGGCKKNNSNVKDYKKCLVSSSGKGYCMVHLKTAKTVTSTPKTPVTPPSVVVDLVALGNACFNDGMKADPGPPPVPASTPSSCQNNPISDDPLDPSDDNEIASYLTPACQAECNQYRGKTIINTTQKQTFDECCVGASLKVINCEDEQVANCDNYEGFSDPTDAMFCEICEMNDSNTTETHVFTYTICPTQTTNFKATSDTMLQRCATKATKTTPDSDAGAYYQTFRLLVE